MRRRFATLDVFTDRRFAGNPLAVVLDAEARRFNRLLIDAGLIKGL